ncbi:MAG: glycoside hydrolase family 44 protein [Planctomycetota bacterium]|nr:glycoside hydrolase family 44 protein [Planctomycetota bacterium]
MKFALQYVVIGTVLVASAWLQAAENGAPVAFEIDGALQWPISPCIYGTNQPDWQGRGRNLTLTRWGGNRITAYNWETNASNAGSDWQHQNDAYLSRHETPGEPVRQLVAAAHAARAAVIVSVPIIGYVAADKNGGGDVNQTPDYLRQRFHVSLPRKNRPFAFPPDLNDGKVFQDEFVAWLEHAFPQARKDVRRTIFYCLDNEPDLWSHTHARIHPEQVRYEELVQRTIEYATAIKAVVPRALVFGPASYGWQGYRTLQDAPDAQSRDFLEFYLEQLRQAEQTAGCRLLDVLDLHWYPEARGGDVRIAEDDARPEVAAARIQAPRSLWDPGYTEQSWITQHVLHEPIRLLPRIREKIDRFYPGTRLAITEYYYGGGGDISGALAQADVLGIFGRERVAAAALWQMGQTDHRFIYAAFAMFRNYDGRDGSFGSVGLSARTSDAERTSVYASLDARQQVVLVAINKSAAAITAEIRIQNCPPVSQAAVYQLTQAEPGPVARDKLRVESSGRLRYVFPARSVSTLVLLAAPEGRR